MEAITSLGIDGKMLIAQIINFLILLFLLNRLLYKPILNLFDERRKKIEQGLKDAEASNKALETANDEAEKIKEKAFKEAGIIIEKAKGEAQEEAKQITSEAHKQADKIIQAASDEAKSIKDTARNEIKSSISDLVTLALGKITNNKLDSDTRDKLTREAVKELE